MRVGRLQRKKVPRRKEGGLKPGLRGACGWETEALGWARWEEGLPWLFRNPRVLCAGLWEVPLWSTALGPCCYGLHLSWGNPLWPGQPQGP